MRTFILLSFLIVIVAARRQPGGGQNGGSASSTAAPTGMLVGTGLMFSKGIEITPQIHIRKFEEQTA